ncbi:MAG: rRNA maturation RNase YbeY [Myxococcota bacterium]|nr:rRNA maturation RNase YbeY [Myxococcota bacterium]
MTEIDLLWDRDDAPNEALSQLVEERARSLMEASGCGDRELSLVLTDDPRIAVTNETWRGVSSPTDVLSFPMDEGEVLSSGGAQDPLGDVMISLDTAGRQALEHGLTMEEEVTFLLVHGFCHLLGHDHAEPEEAARMRAEEDRLLALVAPDLRRPPTPY